MNRRLFLALPLATMPAAAHACLNDRDSDALAVEAGRFPELISVITGRFERNPPRYYELRVERVEKELAADPTRLALYDDLGVALDKLHRDDEAIVWMDRKKARLEKIAPGEDLRDPEHKEAWYRYHANVGTFLVHAWIRRPGHETDNSDLKRARAHIARAIAIKPDAHFGREKYQLLAMDWMLAGAKENLATFLYEKRSGVDAKRPVDSPEQLIQGLAGLIVLGAAWESPDIFNALEYFLTLPFFHRLGRTKKLAHLCRLRVRELLAVQKRSDEESLFGRFETAGPDGLTGVRTLESQFKMLRDEAEKWHWARVAYMEARFAQGRHPDTDPHFWDDWHPAPPPSLEVGWWENARDNFENWLFVQRSNIAATIFLGIMGGLTIRAMVVAARARRAEAMRGRERRRRVDGFLAELPPRDDP